MKKVAIVATARIRKTTRKMMMAALTRVVPVLTSEGLDEDSSIPPIIAMIRAAIGSNPMKFRIFGIVEWSFMPSCLYDVSCGNR